MKNFKFLYKEYANLNPAFAVGGSSTGPGMGQYNPSADLNLRASKQAVSGNKVAKFVTGHDVKFGNKKYKKVEFEVLDVDNNSKSVKVTFISPKELENKVVKMPFKFLRRGPFVATKIPNYFEAVEKINYKKEIARIKNKIKEDFEPVNQGKLSEIIFQGSNSGTDNDLYNMYLPMSSAMFKRVFPKEVRGTFFHVTAPNGFENLYDIQNSKKSIAAFANMSAKNISGGIASGSGVVVEIEANAIAASADDLFSVPIRDGRRMISYKFFHDENDKEQVKGMDKSMSVFLKAMIKKYALPSRVKKPRYSPYFTDFEVFKSIRADYESKKFDEKDLKKKTSGKRMQMLIKDYLNGIERILKKHAKGVQEALTGYLKRKSTDRRWDEIIVDDVNITRIFIVSDHEETAIFKKDQLDHEAYKKNLEYVRVPVEIKNSAYIEKYVQGVRDKSLKENKEVELDELRVTSVATKKLKMYYDKFKDAVTPKEKSILSNIVRELEKRGISPLTAQYEKRNYRKEYDNYQGKPEQIERRSSRNKARRLMGDKAIKGKDVGHKDNNPLNNDPKNLKIEDPSKNRREPRLREDKEDDDLAKTMRVATAKMTLARKIKSVRTQQKNRMDALTKQKANPERKKQAKKSQDDQMKQIKTVGKADIKRIMKTR